MKYLFPSGKDHPLWNGGAEITCAICGKKFKVVKSREKSAKVCSRNCYKKLRSLKYGKENHWHWKGGVQVSYTWAKDFRDLRIEIMKRDLNKCTRCGSIQNLEVHHILPYKEGGKNTVENLITLCKKCHAQKHHNHW